MSGGGGGASLGQSLRNSPKAFPVFNYTPRHTGGVRRIVDAARTTAAHHIVRVRCGGTAMADIVLHDSARKRVQRMLAMSRGGIRRVDGGVRGFLECSSKVGSVRASV